ncbi:hypothetical protein BMF35_a1231 [Aurantiacibacter gangjinensis]|nr:hypothetical protein BMF35_a1231 [Aurantiacibacter gangjinensis]
MKTHSIRNRVIRHARSGNLDRAFGLLEDFAASQDAEDPAVLLLRGRLLKERAKRSDGDEARALFRQSSDLYASAVGAEHLSYPLINAATLALLAGEEEQSRELAQQTLNALDANPDEAETPYWRHATYAEALLLLRKSSEARQALTGAVALAPKAWEDRAVTISQFALISDALGLQTDWLSDFQPPQCLHYTGIMSVALDDEELRPAITQTLDQHSIGFAYGALAAGSDIMVAECLLERGGALHVILPCPRALFREHSVLAVDHAWGDRFDAVLEAAETVDCLANSDGPNPAAVSLAESLAEGLAVYDAKAMQTVMCSLRIKDRASPNAAQTRADGARIILTTDRAPGMARQIVNPGSNLVVLATQAVKQPPKTQICRDVSSALALAAQHIARGDAVAADHRHVPHKGDPDQPHQRVIALLAVTNAGEFCATKAFAFSALAQTPDLVLDPLGEVKAANGTFDVYQIFDS